MRCAAVERVDETGAFQRHVKHRFQCVVKNRIASMVCEVRDKNANGFMSNFL